MHKRIVVKIGTSVLTGGSPRLNRAHMVELVRQCARLYAEGHELILCSSGAIAAGRDYLGQPSLPGTLASKQLLASVGQCQLITEWSHLFNLYDIRVGQILITRSDVDDRSRYLNARDTFDALIKHRLIPIVNENDAVATAEIKVGDNDNLSALVSLLVQADLLILLTDQPGLFTEDPRTNPDAELIPEVHTIDATLRAMAGTSRSGLGVGGMATKLQAADVARRAGADVVIAAGSAPGVIERIAAGEQVGTRFPAVQSPIESRKQWILAGPRPMGVLTIDRGAARALASEGGSLLAAGIREVEGRFRRGATVLVRGEAGEDLARGIVRYDADDLHRIAGLQSDGIERALGYDYGSAVIHRNDLILL